MAPRVGIEPTYKDLESPANPLSYRGKFLRFELNAHIIPVMAADSTTANKSNFTMHILVPFLFGFVNDKTNKSYQAYSSKDKFE